MTRMNHVAPALVKEKATPLPLIFILLFYSGTIIALQIVFPALRPLYPQTIFAGMAILLSALSLVNGNATLKLEWIQKVYIAYCIVATIGLYRSAEVGWLVKGQEEVLIIWKHLVFLMILIAFTKSLSRIFFTLAWLLATAALFALHSMKAILAGVSGLAGRFDNYVGLVSNADYVGIFFAIFVVVFLHLALQKQKSLRRQSWFVLSILSLIIMANTKTRAAFLILAVLVPYWILITSHSAAEIFKKGIRLLLIVGALIIIGSLANFNYGSYLDRFSTITKSDSAQADFNIKSRLFMWEQGIAIGLDNPLLGVGTGATTPYLKLTFEGVDLQDRTSKVESFSLHNSFIQIFAERGLPGLILFCLLLLKAFKNFNAVARYAKGHPERQQLALLSDVGRLYFVGYVIGNMFNPIDNDWTFFTFVALSVSSAGHIHETVPASRDRKNCIAPLHHQQEYTVKQ